MPEIKSHIQRRRIILGTAIAALLIFATNGVFAGSPADLLKQQRARINNAVTERNALLDRIQFAGHNNDSVQLASINASELTIAYALQALESVIPLVRPGVSGASLKGVGEPMQMLCEFQVTQMICDSALIADSRIRDEVQKQIKNTKSACGVILAVTS